jgi:hypothetical protein
MAGRLKHERQAADLGGKPLFVQCKTKTTQNALEYLGCPATFDGRSDGRLNLRHGTRIGDLETAQNFVRGVLEPGVGLVELAGSLARQLTQLIAVGHMRECPKN